MPTQWPTPKPKPTFSLKDGLFVVDIEEMIRAYAGKGGEAKVKEVVVLNAFVYKKYPYPHGARGKELIRRGRFGKSRYGKADDPKPPSNLTCKDMIKLKAVQRVKVRLALTEEGRVYCRVDMFLDLKKSFGYKEWPGRWRFVTKLGMDDSTVTRQAERWHEQGFMIRGTGISQSTLTFFRSLRELKEL